LTADIVVLFILGFVILGLFAIWQWFIERRESVDIKPLVPLGVFALDKGRVSLLFLVAVSSQPIPTAPSCLKSAVVDMPTNCKIT
jgi:hypothetical protein